MEPKTPQAQLMALASELLDAADCDYNKAEKRMVTALKRDAARWTPIMALYTADAIMMLQRAKARKSTRVANPGPDRGLDALGAEYEDQYDRWLRWPLSNGTPLAQATVADIEPDEAHYRKQGQTMLVTADWLRSVIDGMKKAQAETAGKAYDGKALLELYEGAKASWQ